MLSPTKLFTPQNQDSLKMIQLKAYKFKLYPTEEQKSTFANFFGAKRWVFNHYLGVNQQRFLNKEKHLSNYDINYDITKLKQQDETGWLKDIDDWCLKHASEDLHAAYTNFFKSVTGKRKGPKLKAPKFKSRHDKQSYRTRNIKIVQNGIKLPKIKTPIKAVLHQEFNFNNVKSATISKTPAGEYYVSILVEEEQKLLPSTGKEIGCDLGLKHLLILSNGIKFEHPEQMLAKAKLALKKQQRKLAKKTKGSKNHEKQRIKVARLYAKITRIRDHYYHNISKFLVKNFDAIYLEDLNVVGMLKNRKLARKIHESAWSKLRAMIRYKAGMYGKASHEISRWLPSSKTCPECGSLNQAMDLSVREWTCSCGANHDRDITAAVNVLKFGQIELYGQEVLSSQETGERELKIPMSLKKQAVKIERSGYCSPVGLGIKKASCSLDD